MQLLQAKIRCLQRIPDSGWFGLGPGLTLVQGSDKRIVSTLLRSLETLNPLYDCETTAPLERALDAWEQGAYLRKVMPAKKTAVFTIFAADPELVKALSLLEDSLIQTDRIEVGRRLDYSRWISFIELSASARWSDIAEAMQRLRADIDRVERAAAIGEESFIDAAKPSHRIKDELGQHCREWLLKYESRWTGSAADLFTHCLDRVNVPERFKLARRFVAEYLPPIICLNPDVELRNMYTLPELQSAAASQNPVINLMRRLCERCELVSGNEAGFIHVNEKLIEAATLLGLEEFADTLTVDRQGFHLDFYENVEENKLTKRTRLLWIVALLTQVLWQQFPILLLESYDKDLSGTERIRLLEYCERFTEFMQIVLSPIRADHYGDNRSAETLWVGVDGIIEQR